MELTHALYLRGNILRWWHTITANNADELGGTTSTVTGTTRTVCTGTTGNLISRATGMNVNAMLVAQWGVTSRLAH